MLRADLLAWAVRGAGLAAGILVVYGLVQLGFAAGSVLILVFVAILLASALAPAVGWIRRRTGFARGPTIIVVYVTFFVGVLAFALIVVPAAIKQAEELLASLPAFFAEVKTWALTLRPPALSRSVGALVDSVAGILRPPEPPDPETVTEVGAAVAEAAVTLGTLLALVFFWMVEHARLQRYALSFLPAARRGGAREAWNEVESRLGMWIRGQLILMGSIGAATSIAYTLLGLPGAVLLGLIAAIAEAIPIVGPLLGAIPAVLVAATVSPELALVVAVIYLVIQAVEGMVLVPLVMRNTVGISPFLVLASLLVGATVGGPLGALLAVPLAASAEIVLARLQARDVPVAQDPTGIEDPDAETTRKLGRSLPDAANADVD